VSSNEPSTQKHLTLRAALGLLIAATLSPTLATAADKDKDKQPLPERNFYDVLEDVMGDFEFHLKNGEVTGLQNLAIRNIALSENVPSSFKNHIELLLTERILRNTKTKVLQCLPCRSKRTTLNGDQVVIVSPDTNPAELTRIAREIGIEHFMDVAFSYQQSGMVMSLLITQPDSGSMVWSRSYNSETSRAAAFRRGTDYSQTDEARKSNEYTPTLQYRGTAYYMFQPNMNGLSGCLGVGFSMVERYDNRKKEVGFELDYFKDASTLVGGTAAADATDPDNDNIYGGFNLTLLFKHTWNFIGEEENFNKPRGGLTLGVGGTYSSGYLAGIVRAGWEWRLGKHFAISANLGLRPPATAFVGTFETEGKSIIGPEFGLGISLLY
jgi:hypothetical protein